MKDIEPEDEEQPEEQPEGHKVDPKLLHYVLEPSNDDLSDLPNMPRIDVNPQMN